MNIKRWFIASGPEHLRVLASLYTSRMPSSSPAEWLIKRILLCALVLLALSLAVFIPLARTYRPPASPSPAHLSTSSPPQTPAAATLTVHISDTFSKRWFNLPISRGSTVLDLLNLAKARTPPLPFEFKGSGETAFLTSLDGIANEGGGTSSRNWQFWVNDGMATTGIGSATLNPGDRVDWVFEPYSDNPTPPSR